MAFRSGGVNGKGLVYSRRRGRGKTVTKYLRNGTNIIYEENEGESDDVETKAQHERQQTTSTSHTGYVLKDKSNTTRSPKKHGQNPPMSRDDIVGGSRLRQNAPAPKGRTTLNKTTYTSVNEVKGKERESVRNSPPIAFSADDTEAPMRNVIMEPENHPTITVRSNLSFPNESSRQDAENRSDQYDNVQLQKPMARKSSQNRKLISTTKAKKGSSDLAQPSIAYASSSKSIGKTNPERKRQLHRNSVLADNHGEDTLENARKYWGVSDVDEEGIDGNGFLKDEHDLISLELGIIKSQTSPSQKLSQPPPHIESLPISKCDDTEYDASIKKSVDTPPKTDLIAADLPTPTPHEKQTQFRFWRGPSKNDVTCYVPSPTPATDMSANDFVFQRQRASTTTMDKEIEPEQAHSDSTSNLQKGKQKGKQGKNNSHSKVKQEGSTSKGNKWVKFMDFALTCPSDESDDELAFCKPSRAEGRTKG